MKNRSYTYDINRAKSRHGHRYTKYKMRLLTSTWAAFEAQFMKKLSSTEDELKKKRCL